MRNACFFSSLSHRIFIRLNQFDFSDSFIDITPLALSFALKGLMKTLLNGLVVRISAVYHLFTWKRGVG